MEAVSMQNLYNSKGQINWFGWVMFLGTVALILFNLYQGYINVKRMKEHEDEQIKKIMELEMNLREIRGGQYITLNNNKKNQAQQ